MLLKHRRKKKARAAVSLWLRLAAIFGTFIFAAVSAPGEEPRVTAVLTSSETVLGRPVQLQIKIIGSPGAKPPDTIAVDGLDIRYSGQSQMIEGRNFQFSYSFVYSYTVVPERTGTFKIPPQKIQAGSNSLRTPELTLNVADSAARSPRSGRGAPQTDERKLAFAELVVTKTSAYVGEMVPVEIRLCFNARTQVSLTDGPEITGQGFTTQKLTNPRQAIQTIAGQTYEVVSFKTAIAAARTGKFEIGPVQAKAVVAVQRRPPLDMFNLDDPFSDPFFADPFRGMVERREITLRSSPVTLEIKPLPSNAPPEFSGAIGTFTVEADAKPKTGQVGDPLTVTATISGRGNFDRVTAPALQEERGWHKYPPSSSFKQDDDVGISGVKTFEMVLTPNEQKKSVPPLVFTYFDPLNEKYVSLQSNPIPVRIEGGAPAPARPATAAVPSPAQSPAPTPVAKSEDILYQITEWPGATQSFVPLYRRANFWFAQLVPLFALLAFAGWKGRQTKLGDREAQRRADLQHEAAHLQRKLRRGDASPQQYYAEAARAVQIKTALAKNVNPNTVDANAAAMAFELDEATRTQLQTLFERKDELQYSGSKNGDRAVPREQQREVLELIESLHV